MYFRILHDEASGAVSCLLADLETRECVLVDARAGEVPVLRAMLDEHRLRLCWLLHTHEHDGRMPELPVARPVVRRPCHPGSSVFEQQRWRPWLGGTTRDAFLARVRMPYAGAGRSPSHNPAIDAKLP